MSPTATSTARTLSVGLLLLSMSMAAMVIATDAAIAKTFSITISGDSGANFIGSCLVKRSDDHEVLALNGKVPFEQHIEAAFVSCRINANGRILIEAVSDEGQAQHAETNNGMITLSLH